MDELQRLQSIRGIGAKWSQRILELLNQANMSLDDLFAMSAVDMKQKFKLPKNIAQGIAECSPKPPELPIVSLLKQKEVTVLSIDSPNYPKRLQKILGANAPKVLYVWGNLALLDMPSVGFCGSRTASDKGIAVTADTAQQIVELGWVVVSGHAKGVDTTAHLTALAYGGATIIVLAEGISNFKLRSELKKIAKSNQILVVSEFVPQAHWHVGNAMTRNRTIIGLSDAMILVEARSEGGTFEAGKEALRLKVPLYVAKYQSPADTAAGNAYFLSRGAKPLFKNGDTGKANIQSLKDEIASGTIFSIGASTERLEQLPLM